jgi:hypothetical protein
VSEKTSNLSTLLKKEAAVFLVLLLIGLVLLPICIWFVGNAVFGAYDGAGYSDFFGTLSGKIRSGNPVALLAGAQLEKCDLSHNFTMPTPDRYMIFIET